MKNYSNFCDVGVSGSQRSSLMRLNKLIIISENTHCRGNDHCTMVSSLKRLNFTKKEIGVTY